MRPADIKTAARAQKLRQVDNDSEYALWQELRGRRLNRYKFVRQFPIDRYFADFACREEKLVVELDGSQHADCDYDRRRDSKMTELGWSILRFRNSDVFIDRSSLLDTIVAALDGRLEPVVSAELRYVRAENSGHEL